MKRKIPCLLLCLMMLIAALACLSSCGEEDHDKVLSEIASMNAARAEQRRAFLDSAVTAEAKAYVQAALDELIPGANVQISLERGSMQIDNLPQYEGLTDDMSRRAGFFVLADLSLTVNFWEHDTDGKELAEALAARGISGQMAADQYASAFYIMDGVNGKVDYYIVPGV